MMDQSRPLDHRRVVIENVQPEIGAGRFPVKPTAGEGVIVQADILADGQDALAGVLRYRRVPPGVPEDWEEMPVRPLGRRTAPFMKIRVRDYHLGRCFG